jgi:hypothetical protein
MHSRVFAGIGFLAINMALAGLYTSPLAAQVRGGEPSFTLGFRGDDVVVNDSGGAQSQAVICTLTTEGLADDQPGAQGWSFGVQPRGPCRIDGYFTSRMASGSVRAGGLVQSAAFERTELIDAGAGITQAVVLSFTTSLTLSPAASPHDLLGLFIETEAPEGDDCRTCTLNYVEGLQGEGLPVQVVATWDGTTYRPERQSKEIQICPPASCFEPTQTGDWQFASSSAASGAARITGEDDRYQVCGHGSGYGVMDPHGDSVDNVNVIGQTIPGEYDFTLSGTITRIEGADGYAGLEVRPVGVNAVTGFDASSHVFALGVRLTDRNQLVLEAFLHMGRWPGHVAVPPAVEFPEPVGLEDLPIGLRIERRDGALVGSYSTGGRFIQFLRLDDVDGLAVRERQHFINRSLHVGLAQSSFGSVTNGRLATATVEFDRPVLNVELPPPPPPPPSVNFVPGISGQLELAGGDIEGIVSVTIAGLETTIVRKEDGRATINIPETDTPVRGDIIINRDGFSSVIRNAFFRYGTGFIRGDCNDDGLVDISDAIKIFGFLFLGELSCVCLEATNANGDPSTDISDGIFVLSYLFSGGAPPPPPFPERGFSEDSDPTEICGLEEHLPVITNITVLGREGAAAGDEPIQIEEGSRLQIDGRNFSSEPRRNTVVAGDSRIEIVDATSTRLIADVRRAPTRRLVQIGIIADFLGLAQPAVCFDDDCPPALIGPIVMFPGHFEVLAPPGGGGLLGTTIRDQAGSGLVLQLDPATFSPNADVAGREINIEAMLDIPVIQGVSPGARRVSVKEIFPRTGPTTGADGVRRVADSLRRGLAAGGRLSQVSIVADVERSRILIDPNPSIRSALRGGDGAAAGIPFLSGAISVYDTPFGRCGPNNLHPIDDERAFGWCRFEELVEPCNGLPAFEYFFTHHETLGASEIPEHEDPDDRSPESKEVMYNLEAYCHIREHRLWCEADLDQMVATGESEIPPFPRAAWVMKTSWVHESITLFPLAGAFTNMNAAAAFFGFDGVGGNPTAQDFKDQFYSYDYTGNDPHDTNNSWPPGRYYLRAMHHTTKDIDDWYWMDTYVWGGGPLAQPQANIQPKIGGCGGSSEDAPLNIANHPIWGDYRLCTNVTDFQRVPGPAQDPEPTGAAVGPIGVQPSAMCGNFLIGIECPSGSPFFGGGNSSTTCLNCHSNAERGQSPSLHTDFLWSLTAGRVHSTCPPGGVSFAAVEAFIVNSCGCHNGSPSPAFGTNIPGGLPGSLDLTAGNIYANLVNVDSLEVPNMKRIKPFDLNNSYLYRKITGSHSSIPGPFQVSDSNFDSMPGGAVVPPGPDLQLIEDWINSGANP